MRFPLLILLILPLLLFSQEYAEKEYYLVDSLIIENLSPTDSSIITNALKAFHESKEDTTKIESLSTICDNLHDNIWTSYQKVQLELVEEALQKQGKSTTEKKKLLQLYASALNNFGYIYNSQSDYDKALKSYFKSLGIRKQLSQEIEVAQSYHNIAFIYDNQGNIGQAIEYYLKSVAIKEELGDKRGMAVSLNNIGIIYNRQKNYPKAVEYYKRALEIQEAIEDKEGIGLSLINIGLNYQNQKKLDQALDYYKRAMRMHKQINDQRGIAVAYSHYGKLYFLKATLTGDDSWTDSARVNIEKGLAIQRSIDDKEGITISLNDLAQIELQKGNVSAAEKLAKENYDLAKVVGYPKLIRDAAKLLSSIYKKQNKGLLALEMHELYVTMKDSITGLDISREASRQEAKYAYEKQKAIDDAYHEKQLAVEQEEKEKQKVITYATGLGLALVAIFLFVVFNRLKLISKQKGIIETAHHELEEKNQEILDSIAYAKRIQSAILPPPKVVKGHLPQSFVLYKPKDIVAGDFYWLEHVKDKVLFAAADCTGHGVPGAMVSVVCNNGLNRSVREHGLTEPGKILDKTREIVVNEFEKSEEVVKDGMDIALCSLEGNVLHYAGAYNPLWIIRAGAEEMEEIRADKQPIGKTDRNGNFTTHKLELNPGDTVYVFSDGYADQFGGEKGKKMKTVNFKRLLLSMKHESMDKQKQLLDEAFYSWKGDLDQLDDICIIGVRV